MAFDAQSELSDEALLVLYGNGDGAAARALVARLGPVAFRVAFRMLGDRTEAEDLAQEAMLRLWKIAPEWRTGEAKVSTWIYRVTTNLATDRLRRRRGVGLDEAPEVADGAASALEGLIAHDRAAALEMALAQLPARQRQAVVLRHLEGLSNPEIAEAMEIGVEAVESLTARGKRALAALLAERREELGYGHD
ncbi:RNA polymerase ECF family sigma subunit [Rhodobacter aestuarii]|uniref:RNA polymerase, sigma subunit, ECF family n=2 Tax=Rhodobacter aestuarii TaxID=453582 RepID=A0A1N7MN26_9RHOB|nr:RNA polymerase ECF family sigma subunit [Rhodobacter aestuarii]SIS87289.1 RNA polymerase, sigma subunit, ECF family [Rhodobacter aestuarii]